MKRNRLNSSEFRRFLLPVDSKNMQSVLNTISVPMHFTCGGFHSPLIAHLAQRRYTSQKKIMDKKVQFIDHAKYDDL